MLSPLSRFYAITTFVSAILFVGFLSPVYAQENPFDGIVPPEVINQVRDALPKFQDIDISQAPLGEGVRQMDGAAVERDIADSFGGVWESLNAWMMEKLGVSLSEIIVTVLNFMFWLIKLAVKIIRAVLNLIPF